MNEVAAELGRRARQTPTGPPHNGLCRKIALELYPPLPPEVRDIVVAVKPATGAAVPA